MGLEEHLNYYSDNSLKQQILLEYSIGIYVVSNPDHLVIITSSITHSIKKFNAAGDKVRATVQGFFQDPKVFCKTMNNL